MTLDMVNNGPSGILQNDTTTNPNANSYSLPAAGAAGGAISNLILGMLRRGRAK